MPPWLWLAAIAAAQGPVDAGLRGRLMLPDGEAAGHARVLVRELEGDFARTLNADSSGEFLLLRLPPGEYKICAEAVSAVDRRPRPVSCGTEPLSAVERLYLEPGEMAEAEFTLSVQPLGASAERRPRNSARTPGSRPGSNSVPAAASNRGSPSAVGILGVAPELEPTGPAPASVAYTQARLAALPLTGREWEAVAELSSAAQDAVPAAGAPDSSAEQEQDGNESSGRGAESGDGSAAAGLSFAGMSPIQNASMLDGLSEEQSFRSGPRGAAGGGAAMAATFGQGAVRSVRVLPHTFSAEYGGGAGGVLAAVSRKAPSALHGSAFLRSRQSALASTNPFSVATTYHDGTVSAVPVKPGDSNLQFGAAAGNALHGSWLPARLRSRIGVFASLEGQSRASTVMSTPASADFFDLTPMQQALLANRGVSVAATHAALDYLSGLGGATERQAWRVLAFGRADAQVSGRDRITAAYEANRMHSPSGAALGQASEAVVARGRGSLGDATVQIDALSGRWLRVFSPRCNNEVRAQLAHDLDFETPDAPLSQEPGIGPGGLAPEVSIAPNGFAYGTTASLGRTAYPDEHRVQLADTLEAAAGRNLLRLGADWSRITDRVASLQNPDGTFLYDSSSVNGRAGGLVDWITDYTFSVHAYPNGACPSITAATHYFCFRSYTQSFGTATTEFATHDFAGFLEDALRPAGSVRLSVGLRYDYSLLPLPQEPNSTLDAVLASIASPGGGLTETFPEDRNNFGPRVALTWAPGRRRTFTVRLAYGVFFGRLPGATVRAALNDTALPATSTHIRFTPTTEVACPQVANQGFGYPCAFTSAPPQAVAQTTSATVFARSFRDPAVQRATLEVERQFGRKLSLKAAYTMATATQLPGSTDLNIAPATGYANYVIQGGDGLPGLHSGQTFAVPLYTARRTLLFGPVTSILSNANSTYHAGTAEAWYRGRGMELRGSYTFSRSIDYGPQQGATPRLNGQFDPFTNGYDKGVSSLGFPQRLSGDLIWSPGLERGRRELRKLANGWRVAAVAVAGSGAPYSYGVFGGTRLSGGHESLNGSGGATYLPTVGRNTLRLPPRGRVDCRVAREFAPRDRVRLEAFAEAFNLLNTDNLSRVQTRAFLLSTPAVTGGPVPLVFQNAAAIAAEGLTTLPFGAPTSSTTGLSRERQVELGVRASF